MSKRTATHTVALSIRLIGGHNAHVEITGDTVQVLIPGAAVTLADMHVARTMFAAWIEARLIGRDLFTGEGGPSYQSIHQHITAAVRLSEDRDERPVIAGKAAKFSPSGCGQVLVRLGRFAIVADDRAAWQDQYRVWRNAYEAAADIWNLWPVERFETIGTERITERLFQEGRS